MVSYQRWTAIAFEVAQQKGMRNSQGNTKSLVSAVVAPVWQDRKDELKAATIAEAEAIAQQEVVVASGPA